MSPLYFQLLWVIAFILMLGALGIYFAMRERVGRLRTDEVARLMEFNINLLEEFYKRRSAAEREHTPQHDLEHK